MNTPETNNDFYQIQRKYPQVESLFESLNISEQEKEEIQSRFYNIAKTVYGNPEWISNNTTAKIVYENSEWISSDTIRKIKLWETDSESFTIQSDYEWDIIGKYLNFIQSYPNWEKIWRTLTAYYNPIA